MNGFPDGRCKPNRHIIKWGVETTDLRGGFHKCECGYLIVDRCLNPSFRVVELDKETTV